MSNLSRRVFALLLIFILSGFAGLIYQSVWTNYLGLTLGHAAYAQTLVLAIYMGGMALGAWLASKYSTHWGDPILAYAIVEAVVGLLGLVFHPLFVGYTGFSQDTVLPAMSSPGVAHLYQWTSAALLMLPQCILLGATFPLMSAGVIRLLPEQKGESLGGLYFANSFGAALGALAATFMLLPALGLPGTVMTAGMINMVVALGAWAMSKSLTGTTAVSTPVPTAPQRDEGDVRVLGKVLLLSTAVSGAASFVYEIGWVRLLNQVFGTTVHSFELMLAAFILGLAFGGLWIRRRAAKITDPVRYVGYVQVIMGVAALVSIPVFTQSFTWVGWIMGGLARTANGYTLFELATAAVSLLVMFPAAFFAGMTLPLFTLALLRAGAGERAIGRIYAANTLGAIAGVAAATHILIPVLGVRLSVTLAAVVDALVGLYLLRMLSPGRVTRGVGAAVAATLAFAAISVVFGAADPRAQVSGVFRTGIAQVDSLDVTYLRDGKTATIAVFDEGVRRAIATNGKPDASLTKFDKPPTGDEHTMVLTGLLPLAVHPNPERIGVIGWGSGLSTHTLLGSSVPKVVDTIEIERAMVDGASLFGDRVQRAYADPRSKIHIEDARTFFSTGARKYDVIVSEPSNPWVSGVASLFTKEFYAFLGRHLEDDGVLVQWLQVYEINDPLVATMLTAMMTEFPEVRLYLSNTSDLVMVARKKGHPIGDLKFPTGQAVQVELDRVGLSTAADLAVREIGGSDAVRTYARMFGDVPHSDFYPTVSLQAPRTRFMGAKADMLITVAGNGMPVLDVLDCRKPVARKTGVRVAADSLLSDWRGAAIGIVASAEQARVSNWLRESSPKIAQSLSGLIEHSRQLATDPTLVREWSDGVAAMAADTIGHLPPEDLVKTWQSPAWLPPEALKVPEVATVMAAYAAAADRDVSNMRATAEAALRLPPESISGRMREQLLVLAMLGAVGVGDAPDVPRLDKQWGPGLTSGELAPVRSYLMAWAAGPIQACAARRPGVMAGR